MDDQILSATAMNELLQYKPAKILNLWYPEGEDRIRILTFKGLVEMTGVGIEVWKQIDGTKKIQELIQYIKEKYPTVDDQRVEEDVIMVLKQLDSLELIKINWNYLD